MPPSHIHCDARRDAVRRTCTGDLCVAAMVAAVMVAGSVVAVADNTCQVVIIDGDHFDQRPAALPSNLAPLSVMSPMVNITLNLEHNHRLVIKRPIALNNDTLSSFASQTSQSLKSGGNRGNGVFESHLQVTQAASSTNYYQDVHNNAALSVDVDDSGAFNLQGTIGDFFIRPDPDKLNQHFIDSNGRFQKFHILSRISRDDTIIGSVKEKLKHVDDCDAPHLHPELLIFIDWGLYMYFGGNIDRITTFAYSYVNSMDVVFKALKCPKITLHVSSIILPTDTQFGHIEDNKIQSNKAFANDVLEDFGEFVFEMLPSLSNFDIAIQLSSIDLCRDRYDCQLDGMAYVAGGCRKSTYRRIVQTVAIVEESGGYNGVLTAVHEIAHLMSAAHDGSTSKNYLFRIDSRECSSSDGYIMAQGIRHSERQFHFSPCSQAQIKSFSKSSYAKCMRNIPETPRKLVFEVLSLDEQCQRSRGSLACTSISNCSRLFCYSRAYNRCESLGPPMEGTACGERGDKRCHLGQCL